MGWLALAQPGFSWSSASTSRGNADSFYITEAKRLARRGRLIELMGLVHERVEQGNVEDAKSFLAVVGIHPVRTGCALALEQRRLPYLLEFCSTLHDLGIPPKDFLGKQCVEMLAAECFRLLEENRLEDCVRAFEKLANCGFAVKNLVHPTRCMQCFARQHNVELALRYANLLPNLQLSYNLTMQKFRDQGDLQSVFRIFEALEPAGVSPSMHSYCILIDACGRCGELSTAIEIFERLLETGAVLNVYICNSMMNACAENLQNVLRLYRQMQCSGIAADLATYNTLLKSCRLSKNPAIALRLYEELKEKQMPLNTMAYGTLIQIFGEAKMLEQAFRIKQDMDAARVEPNVVTWSALIGACSKAAMADKALQVFQDMVVSGCSPNAYTYNFLLSACVDAGQNEKALALFYEWKSTGRILPDSIDEKKLPEIEAVEPDSVAFNTMLRACGDSADLVEKFMEKMQSSGHRPDKRSWSILINAYGNQKDKEGAIRAFTKMERAGIRADSISYTDVIKACVNSMDLPMAFSYFDAMKRAGVSPSSVTYNALLRARGTSDLHDIQSLLSVYEEMRAQGWPPNERILNTLIEGWAEEVIRRGSTDNQLFRDYGESILRKVSVTQTPGDNLTIDLQGLSNVEARAALLIVLRMLREQHSISEDLVIFTGPPRRNEKGSVVLEVVTRVLENQLGLPVVKDGDSPPEEEFSDEDSELIAVRPVTVGRLKVCKQALNEWIARKSLWTPDERSGCVPDSGTEYPAGELNVGRGIPR